jgi:hypothetical protein
MSEGWALEFAARLQAAARMLQIVAVAIRR